MKSSYFGFIFFFSICCVSESKAADVILCEQATRQIIIVPEDENWNEKSNQKWVWSARTSPDIRPEHGSYWFDYLTDAKPVMDLTHMLITGAGGAGGGVTLVRIADKKVIFYNYAGWNLIQLNYYLMEI